MAKRYANDKMKLVWIFVTVAATLAMGGEVAAFHAVDTEHFRVQVPARWRVQPPPQSTNRWAYVFLDGTNEVFTADVWKGTGFTECFCAPWSAYRVIKREHEEVRTVRIGPTRTLKISGIDYRLDIHASPDGYDEGTIDRVLASIRMKRKADNPAAQAKTNGAPASPPGR